METLTKISADTVAPFVLPNGYICLQFHLHPSGEGVVLGMLPRLKHGRQEFASWKFYRNDLTSTDGGNYCFDDLEGAAHKYQQRVRLMDPLEQARWEIENDPIKRQQWARLLGAEA